MELLFRNDGSLKYVNVCEPINQGSNNSNKVFVAIEGRAADTFTLKANFRLPTGEVVQLLGSTPETKTIDGEEYTGVYVSLSSSVTIYAGDLKMSVSALSLNNDVLVTYAVKLKVNETPYLASDVDITGQQYDNLVASLSQYQLKYNTKTDRVYSDLSLAEADTNIAMGQLVLIADSNNVLKAYIKRISGLVRVTFSND